jgi:hypothetical protein
MKPQSTLLVVLLALIMPHSSNVMAQSMGISNAAITPDPSSILEMRTTDKGILIPRMTTAERDNISSPATGLMLYNTITNQYNFYNGSAWVIWGSTAYLSATYGETLSTISTADVVIPDMTKTALEAGTYSVHFNGQLNIPAADYTTGFSSADAAADLDVVYDEIMAVVLPVYAIPAPFANVTLTPGIYDSPAAVAISGTITLDGQNSANPVFIVKSNAAFNTSASTKVILKNGATAANVFWVAKDAIGLGASTKLKGTLFSKTAAIAIGANCDIEGRLFTRAGAISFGPGGLAIPEGQSIIDFKGLSNFVIFTNSGGVGNTSFSFYTGDIGTNGGAITGFSNASAMVDGTIFESGSTTLVTPVNHMATFSLYKNGVLIPYSSRTRTHENNPSDISLQGLSTIGVGDTIDVRWKIDEQPSDSISISVLNRILTLNKVGN